MKHKAKWGSVSIALAVAACGGEQKPTQVVSGNNTAAIPKTVSINETVTGCLAGHNADNEVSYLLVDKQAKYLEWNCGTHMQHSDRHVRVFFRYDYAQQCFVQASTHVGFGKCTAPVSAPSVPFNSARIVELTATPGINTQGLPGFSYSAKIENTGTVPLFDTEIVIALDNNTGGNREIVDLIDVNQTVETRRFEAYGSEFRGKTFDLNLFFYDPYGQLIGSRRTSVTVN